MRRFIIAAAALLLMLIGCASPPSKRLVSTKGTVSAIDLEPSKFGVSLTLETPEGRTKRVWLGPIRFLIERNFVPTSGDVIEVTGLEAQNHAATPDIVATSIRSTPENRLLVLPNALEAGDTSR